MSLLKFLKQLFCAHSWQLERILPSAVQCARYRCTRCEAKTVWRV